MNGSQRHLLSIGNDLLRVKISPQVGASIFSCEYNHRGRFIPIMRPTPPEAVELNDPGQFSSFLMIPYSNRIENGILLHRGQSYQLAINNPEGHAIHGEVRTRPWSVVNHREDYLELEFNSREHTGLSWPFGFTARVSYTLIHACLAIDLEVHNLCDGVMPAGMGIHPYFVRHLLGPNEIVLFQAPVDGVYPGPTQIPTGGWVQPEPALDFSAQKELTADYLDKCFRVHSRPITVDWVKSGVQMMITTSPVFHHLVVYCPQGDTNTFAIEPVTNCNNGFNMACQGIADTGTVYLRPGQKLSGQIGLMFTST